MKTLTTNEDVYALLHAPAASAALGAAITTGLLWMVAEKPMTGEEVVRALKIPGKRGYYWLQYLQSFGVLETVPQGYTPSDRISYHPAEFDADEFPSGFDLVLQCEESRHENP